MTDECHTKVATKHFSHLVLLLTLILYSYSFSFPSFDLYFRICCYFTELPLNWTSNSQLASFEATGSLDVEPRHAVWEEGE
jgi:hypothetical protein